MDDIKKIDIYELLGIESDATEQEVSFVNFWIFVF